MKVCAKFKTQIFFWLSLMISCGVTASSTQNMDFSRPYAIFLENLSDHVASVGVSLDQCNSGEVKKALSYALDRMKAADTDKPVLLRQTIDAINAIDQKILEGSEMLSAGLGEEIREIAETMKLKVLQQLCQHIITSSKQEFISFLEKLHGLHDLCKLELRASETLLGTLTARVNTHLQLRIVSVEELMTQEKELTTLVNNTAAMLAQLVAYQDQCSQATTAREMTMRASNLVLFVENAILSIIQDSVVRTHKNLRADLDYLIVSAFEVQQRGARLTQELLPAVTYAKPTFWAQNGLAVGVSCIAVFFAGMYLLATGEEGRKNFWGGIRQCITTVKGFMRDSFYGFASLFGTHEDRSEKNSFRAFEHNRLQELLAEKEEHGSPTRLAGKLSGQKKGDVWDEESLRTFLVAELDEASEGYSDQTTPADFAQRPHLQAYKTIAELNDQLREGTPAQGGVAAVPSLVDAFKARKRAYQLTRAQATWLNLMPGTLQLPDVVDAISDITENLLDTTSEALGPVRIHWLRTVKLLGALVAQKAADAEDTFIEKLNFIKGSILSIILAGGGIYTYKKSTERVHRRIHIVMRNIQALLNRTRLLASCEHMNDEDKGLFLFFREQLKKYLGDVSGSTYLILDDLLGDLEDASLSPAQKLEAISIKWVQKY